MTKEELQAKLELAKVKGFNLQDWMAKNYSKDIPEDQALDFLMEGEKTRYENLISDYNFMLAQDHSDIDENGKKIERKVKK
jgi:hypothetical protein